MDTILRRFFYIAIAVFFLMYLYLSLFDFALLQSGQLKEVYIADLSDEKVVVYSSAELFCRVCNAQDFFLQRGNNTIQVDKEAQKQCRERDNYSFYLECEENLTLYLTKPVVSAVIGISGNDLSVYADTSNGKIVVSFEGRIIREGYVSVEIRNNDKPVAFPITYASGNDFWFYHEISMEDDNHVEVFINGQKLIEKKLSGKRIVRLEYIGYLLVLLIAGYRKRIKIPELLALVLFVLILSHHLFDFAKPFAPLGSLLLVVGAIIYMYSRPQREEKAEVLAVVPKVIPFEAVIFSLFFVLVLLVLNFSITGKGIWSSFYVRHAITSYEKNTVDYYDELSYLGRGFTYPRPFFQFFSLIGNLTFRIVDPSLLLIILGPLLSFGIFLMSILLFSDMFKEQIERTNVVVGAIVATIFFLFNTFMFSTLAMVPLHGMAYFLAFLGFFCVDKRIRVATFGLALATHPISVGLIGIFVILRFYNARQGITLDYIKKILNFVITEGIPASLVAMIFYLPIFVKYGLPYEIQPDIWGYFITYGIGGFFYEYNFLLFNLFFGTLMFLENRETKKDLIVLLILLALLMMYVSYRINLVFMVVASYVSGFGFARAIQTLSKKKALFEVKVIYVLTGLYLLATLGAGVLLTVGTTHYCTAAFTQDVCEQPFRYVANHTLYRENVVVNPYFGHLATLVAQRPVLADLYVEYADEEKLLEAQEVYYNIKTAKQKFNINIYIMDDLYIPYYNPKIKADLAGERYTKKGIFYIRRELKGLDRVYDNGFMRVFRK